MKATPTSSDKPLNSKTNPNLSVQSATSTSESPTRSNKTTAGNLPHPNPSRDFMNHQRRLKEIATRSSTQLELHQEHHVRFNNNRNKMLSIDKRSKYPQSRSPRRSQAVRDRSKEPAPAEKTRSDSDIADFQNVSRCEGKGLACQDSEDRGWRRP